MENYKVKTGETIGSIAKLLNVPTTAITGFRSNDPNTIFPDEILTINRQQTITPQDGQIVNNSLLPNPTAGQNTPPNAQNQPITNLNQPVQQNQQITPQAQPDVNLPEADLPELDEAFATYTTPTGAIIDKEGKIIKEAPEPTETDQLFGQYGVDTKSVQKGFQINPTMTLSSLIKQVMEATQLPDIRSQITSQSNDIESLENERDTKIAEVEDNPFQSSRSKQQIVQKITNEYDLKLKNRINRLTLLQNSYDDARQQAQYVATTAINFYSKEQDRYLNQLEKEMDREEKRLEADKKLDEPLSVAEAKNLNVPFGTTVREAYGITPKETSSYKKLSISDVKNLNLPLSLVGKSEEQIINDISSNTPPFWFKNMMEEKIRQTILPDELSKLWNDFKTNTQDITTKDKTKLDTLLEKI